MWICGVSNDIISNDLEGDQLFATFLDFKPKKIYHILAELQT